MKKAETLGFLSTSESSWVWPRKSLIMSRVATISSQAKKYNLIKGSLDLVTANPDGDHLCNLGVCGNLPSNVPGRKPWKDQSVTVRKIRHIFCRCGVPCFSQFSSWKRWTISMEIEIALYSHWLYGWSNEFLALFNPAFSRNRGDRLIKQHFLTMDIHRFKPKLYN